MNKRTRSSWVFYLFVIGLNIGASFLLVYFDASLYLFGGFGGLGDAMVSGGGGSPLVRFVLHGSVKGLPGLLLYFGFPRIFYQAGQFLLALLYLAGMIEFFLGLPKYIKRFWRSGLWWKLLIGFIVLMSVYQIWIK